MTVFDWAYIGVESIDTFVDLEYALTDWLTLGAYIAYYDYLFDEKMREAAAAYNGQWGAGEDKT